MSVTVATNRFMRSSLKQYAEFYQQLLINISGFQELGRKLVRTVEIAHAFREVERVEELALLLSNLPIKEYQLIGQYYLGWCAYRRGKAPRELFEKVIEQSHSYRARAFMSLAAIEAREGNFEQELKHFNQALHYAKNIPTRIEILMGAAVVKGKEGYHEHAVRELEGITPILHYAKPDMYYASLNSLAVELGEVGRIEEAKSISNIVISAPMMGAYPEWQETPKELAMKARSKRASCITVPAAEEERPESISNVFARKKKRTKPKKSIELASVSLFPHRKDTPRAAKPDAVSKHALSRMTIAEKRALVLAFAYHEETTDLEYEKMLEAVDLVKEELREIDLESRSELDELVTDWCAMLGAEEFARVMSALRDCDDQLRLKTIIDTMIMHAFHESESCCKSEFEWKEKVKARLKPRKNS